MPSNEASDDHGDDGDDHKMIKCRTLASGAPDAESERPVQTASGPARARQRTTGTGRRLVRPVVHVRCEVRFVELSEF